MNKCEQVCPYNTLYGCKVKEYNRICPLANTKAKAEAKVKGEQGMTYEEAFKSVNHRLLIMELNKREFNRSPAMMINTTDFLLTAKEAIKKQIPKKPNFIVYDGNAKIGNNHCPKCNSIIFKNLSTRNVDYCVRCGQAIDWSDTE